MPVVLAATDLGPLSSRVPVRAAKAAHALGVPVLLVHVLPAGARADVEARAVRALEAELAAAGAPAGSRALAATGGPDTTIATLSVTEDAALVVLGLHKPRLTLDLLRMTTMERIVLAVDAPVLIAHTERDGDYRSALLATDFCAASAAAARMARRLAPPARLAAVHALLLGLIERRPGVDPDSTDSMAAARQRCADWMAAEALETVLSSAPEILPGAVHDVLAFMLEDTAADLLAIGSGSERATGRLGHYARDLMRVPPTDILVAHAPTD